MTSLIVPKKVISLQEETYIIEILPRKENYFREIRCYNKTLLTNSLALLNQPLQNIKYPKPKQPLKEAFKKIYFILLNAKKLH